MAPHARKGSSARPWSCCEYSFTFCSTSTSSKNWFYTGSYVVPNPMGSLIETTPDGNDVDDSGDFGIIYRSNLLDRTRYVCPNGHSDWDRTNSHIWLPPFLTTRTG